MSALVQIDPEWLRSRFLSGLDRRLRELTTRVDQLQVTRETRGEVLRETERLFHNLAGIGGTYGFPEVTRIARRAERLCSEEMNPARLTQLRRLIAALHRAGGLDSNAA